jgi:hypothetical protein
MQSSHFDNQQPWNDAEMMRKLTSPEEARRIWRSAEGQYLRDQFNCDERVFFAYVAGIHARDRGGMNLAKADWAAYERSVASKFGQPT